MAGSRDLQVFTASLDRFKTSIRDKQDAVVKNIAIELAKQIILGGSYGPGTPVDTSFARNSWYLSYDSPGPTRVPSGLDGSGGRAFGEIGLLLVGAKAGGVIFLTNGATYIRRLEYGWSNQAPAGMVRVVLANAQALVDGVVKTMKDQGVL
jgi:hypothetical protein